MSDQREAPTTDNDEGTTMRRAYCACGITERHLPTTACEVLWEDVPEDSEPQIEAEPLESQVERLARFILQNFDGEPSRNEGAIDVAIRWLGIYKSLLTEVDRVLGDGVEGEFRSALRHAAAGSIVDTVPPIADGPPVSQETIRDDLKIVWLAATAFLHWWDTGDFPDLLAEGIDPAALIERGESGDNPVVLPNRGRK